MDVRPRRRRAVLVLLGFAAALAAAALGLWGTAWTVPQVPPDGASYTLKASWNGESIPSGRLERPIGIAVAPSGDIYVTDARLRVVRFSAAGEFLGEWGREGDGRGEFSNPVGIAVGRNGAVYVSDYEQDRIQKFTASGEFVAEFGRPGSAAGEFNAPAGLAVDQAGSLYVTDFYNHRVQKWRDDGSFVGVIGHAGRLGLGALHYPTGVTITTEGELLVADAYNVPTDMTIAAGGVIHVADSGNHRVVMLSSEGAYVTEWRIPDANPNVYSPEHVAASPDGSTVYATDLAGNRVLVLTVSAPS